MPRRDDRPASVEAILEGHTPAVRSVAERLRATIRRTVPEASERAYPGWHGIGYRHPTSGYFCGIFPRADSVKLGFEWGALLADPDGLLSRGGRRVRYLELRTPDEVPDEAIEAFLLEATALRER